MLHRVIAYSYPTGTDDASDEVVVFFEAAPHENPADRARAVISAAWAVPPLALEFYNLDSETALRRTYGDEMVTLRGPERDQCLLFVGCGPGGPVISRPQRTQYLVGPRWLARLAAARAVFERNQPAATPCR